ncbi:MAG: hypothetical protein JRD89_04355 [Deltaproteobacteria bacterium]|nr:hypothetical protein [Deltaproteobacteria bacterium]
MQTPADIMDLLLKEGGYHRKAQTGAVMLSILQAIDSGAQTAPDIARKTRRSKRSVASMLTVLRRKGAVEVIGKRKRPQKGQPPNIYQLTPRGRALAMYLQHILLGGVDPEKLLSPDQIVNLQPEVTSPRFRGELMLEVFRLLDRGLTTSLEIAAATGWTTWRTGSLLQDYKERGLIQVVGKEKQDDGHWVSRYTLTPAGRRWMLYLDKKISVLEQGERLLRDMGHLQADQSADKAADLSDGRGDKAWTIQQQY